MKNIKIKFTLITLVFFTITAKNFAQQQTIIGLQLNVESRHSYGIFYDIHSCFGFTIEKQLTKHSGISSGLFYRHLPNDYTFLYENQEHSATITEHYLYLPIQYKYYSGVINFSAGFGFSQYLRWTCKYSTIEVNDYNSGENFNFSLIGSLSKSYKIGDRSLLEPSFYFDKTFDLFYGLGISYKYKLTK